MAKRRNHNIGMMPKPHSNFDLDVVIPVYGQFDLFKKCLEFIPAAVGDLKYNVIAVDDAFADAEGCKQVVASAPFPINLLRNKDNVGFGMTCNRGAKAGNAPLIFFLNTDIEMLPHSIDGLASVFKYDERIAVAGPKLLFPEDSNDVNRPAGKIQHAGLEINIHGDPIHIFMGWDRDAPKANVIRQVPAVTGAAIMVRRDIFQHLNGFDPLWGLGTFEDVDFSFKAETLGRTTIYVPQAEGYHKVGASIIASGRAYPLQQNAALFKARWGSKMRWTDWEVW